MDINLAKKNLEKFNAHPDGIFTVSKKEKLVHISSWNLLGRFVKWIQNRHGEITTKVQEVIKESRAACEKGNNSMPTVRVIDKNDPLYSMPLMTSSKPKTLSKESITSSKPTTQGAENSELISVLEYLLRNEIITPQEYDQKLKEKDFSKLPKLRELKKNDLEIKKLKRPDYKAAKDQNLVQALQKYKIDAKGSSNPESFLIDHIDAYLAPYFQGKITPDNENKARPPLIQKLHQDFKAKFPDSKLSKDELETFALDAYIEASSRHFRQLMAASEGELSPNEVLLPALQSSIAIDFKGTKISPENVQSKIKTAVAKMNDTLIEILTQKKVNGFIKKRNINALIKKAAEKPDAAREPLMNLLLKELGSSSKTTQGVLKEAAIERYLEIYGESIKEKILKMNIKPENVHGGVEAALAKQLPELKKGLEKDFPGTSQEIIDARAKAVLKTIAPYIIYEIQIGTDALKDSRPSDGL